jgi:hypothetical protein
MNGIAPARVPTAFLPHWGTHVTGVRFWPGAQPNPDELVERLQDGGSARVFGLRRIGKSSLIAETRDRLISNHSRLVLWIDLQKQANVAGVLKQILGGITNDHQGVAGKFMSWFETTSSIPKGVKARTKAMLESKLDAAGASDVDAYAEAMFEQIGTIFAAMDPVDRPILIFDELPFLIMNAIEGATDKNKGEVVARLNRFLALLRHWRSAEVGIAMTISGSFAMTWLGREHGIKDEHNHDCTRIHIDEMSHPEARAMVEAMAAHCSLPGWTTDSADALLDLVPACYPGVIQFAFDALRYKSSVSAADIRDRHCDAVERGIEDTYHSQFITRFNRYSAEERHAASALFDALNGAPDHTIDHKTALARLQSRIDEKRTEDLLRFLDGDGFVIATRKRGVRFASGLAEAWHCEG